MALPARTLLVFGAGPGIGDHIAAQFARTTPINHIVLLARNASRLTDSDAPFVSSHNASVKVSTLGIDLADLSSIPAVLKQLDSLTAGEDVEVILFNAARIRAASPLDFDVAEIEEDLRTTTLSLYLVAQHYMPRFQALASKASFNPALLVTNSHLPWDPVPQLLSLSLVKAAQKNMVDSLNRAYSASGVHVGLLHVEGVVAPTNKVLNPKTIAERAVKFWEKGVAGGESIRIRE
ncbi:short-chain alcohol dehydrogenase [Pyrenophora seminiperda CCB06]|uniref:Short-chain alcohol dehydrogenase n=1 Tax=Pyrenophora seminiperda CCB06 TaxID=1302712 RepID=A0A3M7MFE7_9PLEO|nr:short-chain alcohol dehydrogenase [Pyrenophora seminiperda CCB06]